MFGVSLPTRPRGGPLACVLGDMDLVRPLGLAVIRCAVFAPEGSNLAYSRYTERLLRLPAPAPSDEALVEALLAFGRDAPQPPVLYFEEDSHLLMVSRHRERLATVFRLLLPPADLVEQLVDKARFAQLAQALDLPVPRARVLHPRPGAPVPEPDLRYPLVVKPLTRFESWAAIEAGMPRGANHVAVAALEGRIYAFGGFLEQNRNPDSLAFAYDVAADRWSAVAPLPRPRGAAAAVSLGGRLHLIGGASAPTEERASVGWHEVYDPKTDAWTRRKALPGARDHVGCVAHQGRIHVIGGRFNTFEYNTGLHHVYLPDRDTWELRAALPTPRSGHGLVIYRDRLFAMGGEGGIINRPGEQTVFGQLESYDPATDRWFSHAPMPTPRHAVGAVTIGDWVYVAGGGAVLGGGVQSAVHEAFTLAGV